MKVVRPNDGILTNFEVLDFLRSRGASKDPARVMKPVAPSEYKVYEYLVQSAACNQTRDGIHNFIKECKKYNLAQAEIVSIVNTRPCTAAHLYPAIEQFDSRMQDEQLEEFQEMVTRVLPPGPNDAQPTVDDGDGMPDEEEKDVS